MRKNTVGLNDPPEMVYRSTESWEYYEDRAGEIYDISYIEDVFTPRYLGFTYKEFDGGLYRVEADGAISRVKKDSLKIFEQRGDGRYILLFEEGDDEPSTQVLLVRKTDGKYKIWLNWTIRNR